MDNDYLMDRIDGTLDRLERIAQALETMARAGAPAAPDYQRPLHEYRHFNWESINASVVQQDPDGPTHVEWGGALWMRRSPSNKYDPAIWFSRANGKDAEGNVQYLRLIVFKPVKEVDQLGDKARAAVGNAAPKAGPPAVGAPTPATGKKAEPALKTQTQPAGGATPPLQKPVNATDYYKAANGSIPHEWAVSLAERVIPDLTVKGVSFAPALPYLPVLAVARKRGLDWKQALAILEEAVMDPEKAMVAVDLTK
jgi:hypothetical protein